MILIRSFTIVEGRAVNSRIEEKWDEDSSLPFDLTDKKNMYNYLRSKFKDTRSPDGLSLCWEIYKWGGDVGDGTGFYSYFPGYDDKGEKFKLVKYGRVDQKGDTNSL